MPKTNGKIKIIENSIFENCTVVVGNKVIDYVDEKRSITLKRCNITIEDDSRITKDDNACLIVRNYAITLKPIIVKESNRVAMAVAIAPSESNNDSDGGAECELA